MAEIAKTDIATNFATPSYENPYDELVAKYSNDVNFDSQTWRNAIGQGRQDEYLSLLEANRGKAMSDSFKDPQLSNFETKMLELYANSGFAEDSEKESILKQVEDYKEVRRFELNREVEQQTKDNLSWLAKSWHTAGTTLGAIGTGFTTGVTSIVDLLAGAVTGIADSAGSDKKFVDAFVDYFKNGSLTDEVKSEMETALLDYARRKSYMMDIDGNFVGVGEMAYGLANSLGQMIPSIALTATGLPGWVGSTEFYTSIFGDRVNDNSKIENAPAMASIGNAAITTAAEWAWEKALAGVFGLTGADTIRGTTAKGGLKEAQKMAGSIAKDGITKAGLKHFGKDLLQEGLEEVLQDTSTAMINAWTDKYYEGFKDENFGIQSLVDSFISGVLLSGIMTGGKLAIHEVASDVKFKATGHYLDSDLYGIDSEGKTVKLKGTSWFYASQLLSSLNEGIADLKKSGDFDQAKEVFSTVSTMAQFFSGMSTARLDACKSILDEATEFCQSMANASMDFDNASAHDKAVFLSTSLKRNGSVDKERARELYEEVRNEEISQYADTMMSIVTSSINVSKVTAELDVASKKAVEKTSKAVEKVLKPETPATTATTENKKPVTAVPSVAETLAKGGVTDVDAVVQDGTFIADTLTNGTKEAIKHALDPLNTVYDTIVITDGNIAIEKDGIVFVPVKWLENYSSSAIFKALETNHFIEDVATNENFTEVVNDIYEYDKVFRDDDSISVRDAMMDFFFNPTVYESYILHIFGDPSTSDVKKKRVTALYNVLKVATKTTTESTSGMKKALKMATEAMRIPTLKAILKWGIDPQDIGADDILLKRDREFITRFKRAKTKNVLGVNLGNYMGDDADVKNIITSLASKEVADNVSKALASNDYNTDEYLDAYLTMELASSRLPSFGDVITAVNEAKGVMKEFDESAEKDLQFLGKALSFRLRAFNVSYSEEDQILLAKIAGQSLYDDDGNFVAGYDYMDGVHYEVNSETGELVEDNYTAEDIKEDTMSLLTRVYKKVLSAEDSERAGLGMFYSYKDEFDKDLSPEDQAAISTADDRFRDAFGAPPAVLYGGNLELLPNDKRELVLKTMKDMGISEFKTFVERQLELFTGDKFVAIGREFENAMVRFDPDTMTLTNDTTKPYVRDAENTALSKLPLYEKSIDVWNDRKGNVTDRDIVNLMKMVYSYKDFRSYATQEFVAEGERLYKEIRNTISGNTSNFKNLSFSTDGYLYDTTTGELIFDTDELESYVNYANKTLDLYRDILKLSANVPNLHSDITFSFYKVVEAKTALNSIFKTSSEEDRIREWEVDDKLAEYMRTHRTSKVSDYFTFTDNELARVANLYTVEYKENPDKRLGGVCDRYRRTITIYCDSNGVPNHRKVFRTLNHEFSHAVQDEAGLPSGGDPSMFNNSKLLRWAAEHFELSLSLYSIFNRGLTNYREAYLNGKLSGTEKEKFETTLKFHLYKALYGELLSERANLSHRIPYGLRLERTSTGYYVRTPDGHRFAIDREISASMSIADASINTENEEFVDLMAQETITNILEARANRKSQPFNFKNTYHSKLTNMSSLEAMSYVMKDGLGIIERATTTLADVLARPEHFLKQEILDTIDGELTEGKVVSALKQYFYDEGLGISIDVKANSKHAYTLVDDNSFDDLLNEKSLSLAESNEHTLAKLIDEKQEVPLEYFYDKKLLQKYGLEGLVTVEFGQGKSETNTTVNGFKISIGLKNTASDSDVINTLNHEFRHVMQYANGFETGFTPNIEVSPELLADVKQHVPAIFEDKRFINMANAGKRENETVDQFIARQFIYFMASGEIEAYDVMPYLVKSKPTYINFTPGKANPTLTLPWYNAKTNEGRFDVKLVGSAAVDNDLSAFRAKVDKTNKSAKSILLKNMAPSQREAVIKMNKREANAKRDEFLNSLEPKVRRALDLVIQNNDPRNEAGFMADLLKVSGGRDVYAEYKAITSYTYNRIKVTKSMVTVEGKETNLAPYLGKTIDPRAYNFIFASTFAKDGVIPKSLLTAIQKGVANYSSIDQYFKTHAKSMSEGLFEFYAKNFYDNTNFDTVEDLRSTEENLMTAWLIVKALEQNQYDNLPEDILSRGLTGETFVEELLQKAGDYHRTVNGQTRTLEDDMGLFLEDYNTVVNNKGEAVLIEFDDSTKAYAYATLMKYYDGTPASIIMVANMIRKYAYWQMKDKSTVSATKENEKYFAKKGAVDAVSEKYVGFDVDKWASVIFTEEEAKEKNLELEEQVQQAAKLLKQLKPGSEIYNRALKLYKDARAELEASRVNTQVVKKGTANSLDSKQKKIQKRLEKIAKALNAGVLKIDDYKLTSRDEHIEDYFLVTTRKDEKGREYTEYSPNPKAWSVGRGVPKGFLQDLARQGVRKHSYDKVDRLLKNLDTIDKEVLKPISADKTKLEKQVGRAKDKLTETRKELKQVQKRNEKLEQENERLKASKPQEPKVIYQHKERTEKGEVTIDIKSTSDVPAGLKKLIETKFTEMGDTLVQFASKGENGELYSKDKDPKEFKSRTEHEIQDWNSFFDANSEVLLNMEKSELFEIYDWFRNGNQLLRVNEDGISQRLSSYELFFLAYLYSKVTSVTESEGYTDEEIDAIRKLYEQRSHEAGSALNTVGQMMDVINPYKRITSRSLEDVGFTPDLVKEIETAIDDFRDVDKIKGLSPEQRAELRRTKATEICKMYEVLAQKAIENERELWKDLPKGERLKKFGERIMSWRYVAMLSSPLTAIRNVTSNFVIMGGNAVGDLLTKMITKEGTYKEGEYDIARIQTSEAVKAFIEQNLNNKAIEDLYRGSTKYDFEEGTNKTKTGVYLKNAIMDSFASKYMNSKRFGVNDDVATKALNAWGAAVDWLMSDKAFIKRAVGKYFGKMLTYEAEKNPDILEHGLTNKVMNLFVDAVFVANEDYMHKTSAINAMFKSLEKDYPGIKKTLQFIFPFANSGLNWFLEYVKFTPAGLIKSIIDYGKVEQKIDKLADARSKGKLADNPRLARYLAARDIGKGIAGTFLCLIGLVLHLFGILRVNDDDDKIYATVGNVRVDVSDIFAFNSILMGAAVGNFFTSDDPFSKKIQSTAEQLVDYATEGFILKDLMDDPYNSSMYDKLINYTESSVSSFVPQVVRLVLSSTSNVKRKPHAGFTGYLEKWANRLTSTTYAGEIVVNPYTGEAQKKYELPIVESLLAKGVVGGAKIKITGYTGGESLARGYGVNKTQLKGDITVDGKSVQLKDTVELNKKYGQLNSAMLQKVSSGKYKVKSANNTYSVVSWDNMTDDQKQNVLERLFSKNSSYAKIYEWTNEGHKYYASETEYAELKKLGIVKGVYRGDKGYVE